MKMHGALREEQMKSIDDAWSSPKSFSGQDSQEELESSRENYKIDSG